ncbi:MAG: LCP family protein [bacterium]|nr:LCP family protein [bacterium]
MISAFLSALFPGLGQLRNGQRRKGAALIAVGLLILAVSAFLVWRRPLTLLTWGVQPTALGWLIIGNGALLALRAYAVVDGFVNSPDGRPTGRLASVVVPALGLVVAAVLVVPHAFSGYGLILDKDLLTTVFAPSPAAPPPTTSPPITSATSIGQPGDTVVAAATSTTTTTIPVRLWEGTERLNVLLLGGDAGVGRTGLRTDTIILASLDPGSGDVALFSVPRNIAQVPLPETLQIWSCDCFPSIINELWDYGERNPQHFPGSRPPGAAALIAGIEELTGAPIHHFALVNLDGFVDLVDAIGGVDITVTERIFDSDYPHEDGSVEVIDIAPGAYHMNGHLALAYARTREGSDDYNRTGRQRCLLQAVASQADPVTVARSFSNITNTIKNNLLTDIPLERLPDLIQIIPKLDPGRIVAIGLQPPTYTGARTADFYPTPNLEAIHSAVATVLDLPAAEAIAALGLETLGEECS